MTGITWKPLQLAPVYKNYVWGGNRLRPGNAPTAEAWVVSAEATILTEPFAGMTLSALAAAYPDQLLGRLPVEQTGTQFPLLIKLLDSAAWLSLQVHPNDKQARRLEGEGYFGKTEAWHIIEADPEARIIAGFKPGTHPDQIREAIRLGNLLDYTQEHIVSQGQTLFIQPGTLHAVGPGLLLYEVQQSSNITYRVWDWGRPQAGGRVLHIEKSLEVIDLALHPQMIPAPDIKDGDLKVLCVNPYFSLSILGIDKSQTALDTSGRSFHAITVLENSLTITIAGGSMTLDRMDTALIPSACGKYELDASTGFAKALLAQVVSIS